MATSKAIVSVSNDLATDQRVHKVCGTLESMGFDVLLVGRKLKGSLPLERSYRTKRMCLLFNKGPLFYAELNLRLFFFLLFRKAAVLVANDLDTLLANHWAQKFKSAALVYDSHEYFTEVPELVGRPFAQNTWRRIEKRIFPKLKNVITVNGSIASMYREQYGVEVKVVRNVPLLKNDFTAKSRAELGLPEDKAILLMQGSGINIDRGAEEAVAAMQFLEDAILLVIGGGDVFPVLENIVVEKGLGEKVVFKGKMPYAELCQYTANADIGLTLDKNTNINYRFSLPNKLFDFIHAGVPVLATNLDEVARIVLKYKVGKLIERPDPELIANAAKVMLADRVALAQMAEHTRFAARELNWQKEERTLKEIYGPFKR